MPPTPMPLIKWAKSDARKLLLDDLKSGRVPMDMKPAEVFMTRPEYAEYDSDYARFRGRLSSLKKQSLKPPQKPKRISWAKSKARSLLWRDLRKGYTPMDMEPEQVFLTRPEFAEYDDNFDRFKSRLVSLRKQCVEFEDRAAIDAEAFAHDRALHPFPLLNFRGEPQWPDSVAEMLLNGDIDDGLNAQMPPRVLHQSRVEYQEYSLSTFRDHIYQEVTKRKYYAYLIDKDEGSNTIP
jgi:hypothetical protein